MNAENRGFTLLELLVVIAIIAILAAFIIFILNPAETLKKSRDSARINDLTTTNKALGLYLVSHSNPDLDGDGSRGSCATHVFVGRDPGSATITDSTIAGKTLKITFPIGDSSNTNIDGSGWIPVNLSTLLSGSPIGRYLLDPSYSVGDPANVTDSDRVYLYGCDLDFTWELNANLESVTYSAGGSGDRESADGGNNSNILEIGSKLTILGSSGVGGGGGSFRAFVSSATYTGDLGGLAGADLKCQTLAAAAGLGAVTWKAWLSSSTVDAASRLVQPSTPILRVVDGVKIADNWADLVDGTIDAPISRNESGAVVSADVLTNTLATGTRSSSVPVGSPGVCGDWTRGDIPAAGNTLNGIVFDTVPTDSTWTNNTLFGCWNLRRLYCFSQGSL